ncbi:hypothetical protein ACJOY7_06450 [Acinetobacter baumannii]
MTFHANCDIDILKLDKIFAEEVILFHTLPLQAAKESLGKNFSINLIENSLLRKIEEIYEHVSDVLNSEIKNNLDAYYEYILEKVKTDYLIKISN